jgi:hypothetical protein
MSPKFLPLTLIALLTVLTSSLSAQPVTFMGVDPVNHVSLEACAMSAASLDRVTLVLVPFSNAGTFVRNTYFDFREISTA